MKLSNEQNIGTKAPSYVFSTLIFLLICRLVSMYFVPLHDPSEARYAEIARKMLETGNWVTPMHFYDVPFWAKPPLSFWLSAFSMKLFGVNEFAVRLPSLCLSMGIVWLIWSTAKSQKGTVVAKLASLVVASSIGFLIDAGAVMTDPSLLFCSTLSLVAFWRAVVEKKRTWSYVFFIGLGLGLLAKGPLVLVLTGLPIFLWVLLQKKWREVWLYLPWLTGGLLMLAIALPWYLLAESRTPGFLNYFLIGEHISRFAQSGWQGDKYGHAHSEPFGMIWLYALIGIFPWTIGVIIWCTHHVKKIYRVAREDSWTSYWFLAFFIPLIFFTLARNIIWTYILPSLPAFSLLFAEFYNRSVLSEWVRKSFAPIAATSGLIVIVATFLYVFAPQIMIKSQKPLITLWKNHHPSPTSNLVFWSADSRRFFSWEFYSSGRVKVTSDPTMLSKFLSNNQENYLITKPAENLALPNSQGYQLKEINTIRMGEGIFKLYRSAVIVPRDSKDHN